MTHLVLDRLTKRYGDHIAVQDLTLSIAQGEFVSLLGPSGCGKTTTLQMIAGFVEPTSGSIRIDGRDLVAVPAAKRGLGVVFQNYALFPHMPAADNVAFGLEMRQVSKAERARRVADTLELVGLTGFAERYPAQLSGGQQQRVALARALVIEPAMLLLDEPLSNLDAKLREEMQVELSRIQDATQITTLMVTHDQSEALALSDRVVVMNAGRIEQNGAPVDAYENPATGFVCDFLGKGNRFLVDALEGSAARIGPLTIELPAVLQSRVQPGARILVRPEKISFAMAGAAGAALLPATVESRVFHGNHWLYQLGSPLGSIVVVRQNDGAAQPQVGDEVRLAWRADAMRAVPDDFR